MYSGLCHKAGINYEGGWLEGKVKIEIYESKLANFKKQFFTAKKCGSIIKNENNWLVFIMCAEKSMLIYELPIRKQMESKWK